MIKNSCADCKHHFCRYECIYNGEEKNCIGATCLLNKGYLKKCFDTICDKFERVNDDKNT